MMFRRPNITDAQGQTHRLCKPEWRILETIFKKTQANTEVIADFWLDLEKTAIDFAASTEKRPKRRRIVGVRLFILAFWTYCAFSMIRSMRNPFISNGFFVLSISVIFLGISTTILAHLYLRGRWRFRNSDLIIGLMLDQDLCPVCVYNLQGLKPASAECLACPECGSSWNVSNTDKQ